MDRQHKEQRRCNKSHPDRVVEGTPQHHEMISIAADFPKLSNLNHFFAKPRKLLNAKVTDPQRTHLTLTNFEVESYWPTDLVEHVRVAIHSLCNWPSTLEFKFKLSHAAKIHNARVLERYNFHLGAAIIDANSSSLLDQHSAPNLRTTTPKLEPTLLIINDWEYMTIRGD